MTRLWFDLPVLICQVMPLEGTQLVNGEIQKRADEILAEAKIAHTLTSLRQSGATTPAHAKHGTSGFVELLGLGVSRGQYAPALVAEWQRWNAKHSSENESVDCFGGDQVMSSRAELAPDLGANLVPGIPLSQWPLPVIGSCSSYSPLLRVELIWSTSNCARLTRLLACCSR